MSSAFMRRGRFAVLTTTLVLAAGVLPSPVSAAPGDCATIMPLEDVATGMTGNGWTVVRGNTPQRFRVEVLGILPDALAADKDLIVVEVSDAAGKDFIDGAGGIWAGMSGSPVYVNGQLIGAVAYSLTGSTSPVGGVTPAEDMAKVLDYASAPAAAAAGATPNRVRIPTAMRGSLAARAGVTVAQATTFSRLPVPLAVSGMSARARAHFQASMDRAGVPVIVTAGSAAPGPAGTFGDPVPGGNFAAVISYGDITAGGIGTTTYVCGDQALAFGHPMQFRGPVGYGANDAWAIRIVSDPIFGSYKLATIEGAFGTVDQDRLSAIRAALGESPELIEISSLVTSLGTGNSRDGSSDVTMDLFVPDIAFGQLVSNIDPLIDRIGGGSSRVRWTISGHRENGAPWSYTRTNRYASADDISVASSFELADQLFLIETNPFEDISFDSVEIRAWVDDAVKQYSIEQVEYSKNGGPFRSPNVLRLHADDELRVKVWLRQYRGALSTRILSLDVPEDATGDGFIQVIGGGDDFDLCTIFPEDCPGVGGFAGLLDSLDNAPRSNSLSADLQLFSFDGPGTSVSTRASTDRVVFGSVETQVLVLP